MNGDHQHGHGCAHGGVDRDQVLGRVELRTLLDNLTGPPGPNKRWHCPDASHTDEHPSVTVRVDPDGVQRWRCWSGGHRGTAIDAVMVAQRVDVGPALRWLAVNYANLPVLERPLPPPAAPLGRPDPEVIHYVDRASKLLWTAAGRPQREWLASRGLNTDVLRVNRIGADPGRRYLPRPQRGFPPGWPAVVYPALDPAGHITYFQSRYLKPPETRSKYDNPSAQHASNPRLAWTIPVGEPRPGLLAVCEGAADALVAAQAGFRSVGVLGSMYPDASVAAGIARVASTLNGPATVVICFDSDPSGRIGAARLAELLAERNVPTAVVAPPDQMDLTDCITRDPGWVNALEIGSANGATELTAPAAQPTMAHASVRHGATLGVLEMGLGLSIDGPG